MSDSASDKIPFASLGIPISMEERLARDAPSNIKRAIAAGKVPVQPSAQLGVLYLLAGDPDKKVSKAARSGLRNLPTQQVLNQISMKTHPKVLEFIAEFRKSDPALDERIGMMRTANDRTVITIARRANKALSDLLSRNHERLLVTPQVFVAMHANPECPDASVARAEAFLRMQDSLPDVPAVRPFLQSGSDDDFAGLELDGPSEDVPPPPVEEAGPEPEAPEATVGGVGAAGPQSAIDLMAEVQAALLGQSSPMLHKQHEERLRLFDLGQLEDDLATTDDDDDGFQFNFADANTGFTFDLTGDHSNLESEEKGAVRKSIEHQIKDMSVGQKIKLAYLGNKEARSYLIRDRNRIVAGAVVKSGRLTDQEVAAFAGNKNLDSDVIREIAANREWIRKYPVKVSLVNNPKTPVAQAVAMVSQLQKKDLLQLTRNRNVPSVVGQAANRLYRQKYKKM